jgi:hypothetical protein
MPLATTPALASDSHAPPAVVVAGGARGAAQPWAAGVLLCRRGQAAALVPQAHLQVACSAAA